MSEEADVRREPGVWAWYRLEMGSWWPVVLAAMALGGLMPLVLGLKVVASAALIAIAVLATAWGLIHWRTLSRRAPLPLSAAPAVSELRRHQAQGHAVYYAFYAPLFAIAVCDMVGHSWLRCAGEAAVFFACMLVVVLLQEWCTRPPQARDLSPLRRLEEDLARLGYAVTLHETSPAGHATVTLDTSHGRELLWYLHCEEPSRVLPEMVLLMWKQLGAHNMARGWIVTRATWSARMAEFVREVGVVFARPDHFAEPSDQRQTATPVCGPDASLFRARVTRRRS